MIASARGFADYFDGVRRRTVGFFRAIPAERIDWAPKAGEYTCGDIVRHVTATERMFVVTGIPDEKKGERLVVLHKLADGKWTEFATKLGQLDLPNLWKPRADQFYHVDALPLLGTGKLDLRKVRELAAQFSKGAPGA